MELVKKAEFTIDDIFNGGTIQAAEAVGNEYLPQVKMHFLIQDELEDPHCLHLWGVQEAPMKLEKGWTWTTIATKDAARFLNEDGDSKFYEKGYKSRGGDATDYDLVSAKEGSMKGYTILGIISTKGGKVSCLAEIDCFKVMESYFKPLASSTLGQHTRITINIENHKENLVKSKSGNSYYGPKKFDQYKKVEIDKKEIDLIVAEEGLVGANSVLISKWVASTSNAREDSNG